jgi:CheY-like chemotaxis protein
MVTHPSILLIEDSPGECELFRLALAQTSLDVALYTEDDAGAAFRFLEVKAKAEVKVLTSTTGENHVHAVPNPINPYSASTSAFSTSPSTGDQSDLPSLILLDLKLGRRNGCDFLIRLRADARLAAIPVVVFTTSDDPTDLARCYASGANGYVVKPGTFEQLVQCIGDIVRYWIDRNLTPYPIGVRC